MSRSKTVTSRLSPSLQGGGVPADLGTAIGDPADRNDRSLRGAEGRGDLGRRRPAGVVPSAYRSPEPTAEPIATVISSDSTVVWVLARLATA